MEKNENELAQKKVAFYTSLVNAWIQTRMEVDKTLIIISSAGIGFLITLLTNQGITCVTVFIVYLAAFISFFVVIVLCIIILHRNSSYIEALIENQKAKDRCLETLDYLAKTFFALALIFTLIIGISMGFNQLYGNGNKKGDQIMTEIKEKKIGKILEKKSFTGLDKLNPGEIGNFSVSGLGGLSPDKSTDGTSTNTDSDQPKETSTSTGSDQSTKDKKK
jgi:hypothetical protein